MNTFNKMWGVFTPEEAKAKIQQQVQEARITEPKNLEAVSYTHLHGLMQVENLQRSYQQAKTICLWQFYRMEATRLFHYMKSMLLILLRIQRYSGGLLYTSRCV